MQDGSTNKTSFLCRLSCNLLLTGLWALGGLAEAQSPRGAGVGAVALNPNRFILFCPNAITQNFPTFGPPQTTWLICWHEVAGNNSLNDPNGLVIGPVYFRKSPTAGFVRVLWDILVSDYFVPYHPANPPYYDLSGFNFVLPSVSTPDGRT